MEAAGDGPEGGPAAWPERSGGQRANLPEGQICSKAAPPGLRIFEYTYTLLVKDIIK